MDQRFNTLWTKSIVLISTLGMSACALQRSSPEADFLVQNVRIVGASGSAFSIGYLAVKGATIISVGAGTPSIGTKETIDGAGMTLMPGMIDTHVHLITGPQPQNVACENVIDNIQSDLQSMLEAGVTTVMSVGDRSPEIGVLKKKLAEHQVMGPTLLVTGPVFAAPDHPGGLRANFCNGQVNPVSDADARKAVDQLAATGVNAIKVLYDERWPPRIEDSIVSAIVEQAHKHGLPVVAHVQTFDDAEKAVDLGIDKLVHFPHIGEPSEHFQKVLADRSIPIATTAHLYAPVSTGNGKKSNHGGREFGERLAAVESDEKALLQGMRRQMNTGVTIAFGTDRYHGEAHDAFLHEIDTLADVFTPAEIVTLLTSNAAKFLGHEKITGSLAVGLRADLILVEGDPTKEVSALKRVRWVMSQGRIVVDKISGSPTT